MPFIKSRPLQKRMQINGKLDETYTEPPSDH